MDDVANNDHHQTLMDKIYSKQRHIYDASRKYYLLGRDHLISEISVPENGTILEVGCDTGRNLICASQVHPNAQIFGVDISTQMLKSAGHSIEKHRAADRISIAQGDATSFDPVDLFNEQKFDCIFISYSLSMIPPWRETLTHALTMLKEDGTLHIVDFGEQSDMPTVFKKALLWWLALFHVSPRSDLNAELQILCGQHSRQLTFTKLLKDYSRYFKIGRKESGT